MTVLGAAAGRTRRRILAVALSGVASLPLWSCRQLASLEERAACEGLSAALGCDACLRAECCDAAAVCKADPECAAIDACLGACSTEDCTAKCHQQYEGSFRGEHAALASCRARACKETCGVECGGYPFEKEFCATCSNAQCCTEATACGESTECLALLYCRQSCAFIDSACHLECEHRHPNGVLPAVQFTGCLLESCARDCGYAPPDLSCSHDPEWPGPVNELEVDVIASWIPLAPPMLPDPGAVVRLCEPTDETCSAPLTEGTTNEAGHVRLSVNHGAMGYIWVDGSAPVLFYPGVNWRVFDPRSARTFVWTINSYKPEDFAFLMAHQTAINKQKGHIWFHLNDCSNLWLPGVTVSLKPHDPEVVAYYGSAGEQSSTATSFPPQGGFLNVIPGKHVLEARSRDKGDCVTRREIVVRAGAETQLALTPGGCLPEDATPSARPGSCTDKCLDAFPVGPLDAACRCDAACAAFGDCCADFDALCKPIKLPAGCLLDPSFVALCNPVTNQGCGAAEACDFAGGGFKCYAEGNIGVAGAACEPSKLEYCIAGSTCDATSGMCQKFCCQDSDCAAGGCVAFDDSLGTLGLCAPP